VVKIIQKALGYVCSLSELPLLEMAGGEAAGMEDDRQYGSPMWLRQGLPDYVQELEAVEPPPIHAATDSDGEGCRLVVDGYRHLVVDPLAEGLDIDYEAVCKKIQASQSGVTVTTAAGERHEADYVVVTVPLGVLKGRHELSRVEFSPALPKEKVQAIRQLGMGAHNKVILRFREPFWPEESPYLNCPDQNLQWLNLHAFGKHGVLLTHVWPPLAYGWDNKSDDEIVSMVLEVLQGMFSLDEVPSVEDYVVTRWDSDPFSMGSYSFGAIGSSAEDVEHLRRPCGHGRVYFAGEATSAHTSQCVHGAYVSGQDASEALLMRAQICDTQPNEFRSHSNSFAGLLGGFSEDDSDEE